MDKEEEKIVPDDESGDEKIEFSQVDAEGNKVELENKEEKVEEIKEEKSEKKEEKKEAPGLSDFFKERGLEVKQEEKKEEKKEEEEKVESKPKKEERDLSDIP